MLERVVPARSAIPTTIRVDQGTSSSRAISICGLITTASRSTSRGQASHRQRLHRSVQRPLPGRVPERHWFLSLARRPEKVGGLAQVLQRGTPTRRDRQKTADHAAQSRWRNQPAIVNRPENSNLRRSKDRSQSTVTENSTYQRMKVGAQVSSHRRLRAIVRASFKSEAADRDAPTESMS